MFEGQRYMTRGVANQVCLELQLIIWGMIDVIKAISTNIDYLQVFELTKIRTEQGKVLQQIIHKQEQPKYLKTHMYQKISVPLNAKIFIIDSGEYCTMMLAEEY